MQKFVPRGRVGSFRYERTRSTPLDPKLMFWCVSYHRVHSGPFGCVTKIGAKWAELVRSCHKVASEFFCNECTRSNPLDPKLMFWCISYHLGASRTVWLPHETGWKMGRTSAKVRATKSCRNFSQRTQPIHPLDPKLMLWYISYYLDAFGSVWLH